MEYLLVFMTIKRALSVNSEKMYSPLENSRHGISDKYGTSKHKTEI